MVKVVVEHIVVDLNTHAPIVILTSEEGEILPIVIGIFEAQSILRALENAVFARPLTHDLIKKVIESLGGKMVSLEIHSLLKNVYYSDIVVDINGNIKRIDCRPSDGISLALRFNAPIFVSENLLEKSENVKYYFSKPIDSKEAEEFRKTIENLDASEFWKKIKNG